MTRIYAERNENGWCYLRLKGHATGSVKACAAMSGLVSALAGYLANATRVKVRSALVSSADALIEFRGDQMAEGAFMCTVIGLLQISKEYGEYVDMEYIERKN